MQKLKTKAHKTAADNTKILLYIDPCGACFIGRAGDDLAYHPIPMGAFISESAAKKWADKRFAGGIWSHTDKFRKE